MIVYLFWRNCDFRNKQWGAVPVDAFWVEATQEEAETAVFPRLSKDACEESIRLASQLTKVAAAMRNPPRAFCFLVARDLSFIDPFPVHYPVHPLWNAYSPFEVMPEIFITNLDELRNIPLP